MGEIPLEKCIGPCRVIDWEHPGAEERLTKRLADGTRKILLKGSFELTLELTGKIADARIDLLGVENCTVENKDTGPFIHKRLLEREILILEGLVLRHVPEGDYLLAAQLLNLGDLDGAPCRAVLLEMPVLCAEARITAIYSRFCTETPSCSIIHRCFCGKVKRYEC